MCRLVIHVTGTVETKAQSDYCKSDECYSACGDISPNDTPGLQYRGKDQIIRFFFVNLSQLSSYVGSDAQRVFVYAQTVLIDADLSFPFSLLVRTRHLILDQQYARTIRIRSLTPDFDLDFSNRETFGISSDSLFMKQSFMCARILLDTRERANANTAWSILDDLIHLQAPAVNNEQEAWLSTVKQFTSYLAGLSRRNVHFVPFYSKEYFSRLLQLYSDRINVYKVEYERMLDSSSTQLEYQQRVSQLIGIYESTSLAEAKSSFDIQISALGSSNTSFHNLKNKYDAAMKTTNLIGQELVKERKSVALTVFKFVKAFVGFLFNLGKRIIREIEMENRRREAEAVQQEIQRELDIKLSGLTTSLCEVDVATAELNRFFNVADSIIYSLRHEDSSFDYGKYEDDINAVVSMKVSYPGLIPFFDHLLTVN